MQDLALSLELGRPTGSGPSRRLRREGKVPATVYGLGGDAVNVTVDYRDLRLALSTEAGFNVVLNLEVGEDRQLALVKEMQRHPLRGDVLHVDFVRVDPDVDVAVDVPIRLVGYASAVDEMNGIVDHSLTALHVLARPRSIPNELVLDISDLSVGSTITVSELELPGGVESLVPETMTVVSGIITRSALMDADAEDEGEGLDADATGDEAAEDGAGEGD